VAAVTAGVVAAGATAYSAYKGSKTPKGGQSTTQEMPAWQREQFMRAYNATNAAANRTPEQAVAGFNPDQTSAFAQIRANQGMGLSDMDQNIARGKGLAGAVDYTDVDLAKYQNPYNQSVINSALDDLWALRSRGNAQIASDAEAAGAWGGDRAVVAQSLNNEAMDRTAASTIANLRQSGFNTAAQLAQNDASMRNSFALNNRGLQLSGNAQLQAMIEARRNAANSDASNLLAVGNQQQAQDQALRDWMIQRAKLMGDIASQSGGGGTSTTQTYGAPTDRVAATMQGLNSGLQFGRNVYDIFKTNSPVDYVQLSPDIKRI